MVALTVTLPCVAGGTSEIKLNFECKRSGSTNDNCAFRVIRRGGGQPDYVIPSEPQFVLANDRDVRGWSFIDINIPVTGTYSYTLQIKRIDGGGTFYGMSLTGNHYTK